MTRRKAGSRIGLSLGVLLGMLGCAEPSDDGRTAPASRAVVADALNCPDPDDAESRLRALKLLDQHGPVLPTEDSYNFV